MTDFTRFPFVSESFSHNFYLTAKLVYFLWSGYRIFAEGIFVKQCLIVFINIRKDCSALHLSSHSNYFSHQLFDSAKRGGQVT